MNWFITALKEKYAEFNGRARRAEYWNFFLYNLIISVVLGVIGGIVGITFISYIYAVAVLVPGVAVAIRRMHDVDKSGWFILIPIYNIILVCTPGTIGSNQYGPDPKVENAFGTAPFQQSGDQNILR